MMRMSRKMYCLNKMIYDVNKTRNKTFPLHSIFVSSSHKKILIQDNHKKPLERKTDERKKIREPF